MGNKIFEAIPKIMSEVGVIEKTRENKQGSGYMFRGIDDVYSALQPLLHKHGVFFVPSVLDSQREERISKSGGTLIYTVLKVKYTFFADDGSTFESIVSGEAMDSGDKSSNKAMSAALKYVLLQVFCIPTEEEKDTEYNSHELQRKPDPRPVAPRPVQTRQESSPPEASGAYCDACGTGLVLSKSGAGYYCPKFKDESMGEHSRLKASDLQDFKMKQEMARQNDVPF